MQTSIQEQVALHVATVHPNAIVTSHGFILGSYDLQDVCAALRRDMHHEENMVAEDHQWADVHSYNVHRDKYLLQLLNPKGTHAADPDHH